MLLFPLVLESALSLVDCIAKVKRDFALCNSLAQNVPRCAALCRFVLRCASFLGVD
ncbi:hypothetical protein POREN0001_0633 [Porphyromonas endodontalis ATCC 35406]|uniref:Uncharacterized protein n=1 Tax=Porphyromonas endodontalis (strain ATCC 35406 / DSM 24491 / JCM 8526 / CCUG 16442 / BCRC 14492 / NCTC 13058 / HG 370) TaxID=553175 RepID=C3J8W2_POREA|nr:hypothetical protein POREN0001_0633 [Porphyromonas endodontalis ATCC 35406]